MAEDETLLIQTLLNQENDEIDRDDFGNVKVGTRWNIISGKWYRCWRASKGLSNHEVLDQSRSDEPLGPVDNSDLLLDFKEYYRSDGSSRLDWVTKQRMVLGDDYFIFPPKAWKVMIDRYGVKPDTEISRFSILVKGKETQVEVSLRKLRLAVVSVAERKLLAPKDIYFSRKNTISEVKARIIVVLKDLVREDMLQIDNIRIWKLDQFSTFDGDVKKQFDESEAGALLDFPGRLVASENDTLDTSDIMFEATLIAEVKESEGNWLYQNEGKATRLIKCGGEQVIRKTPVYISYGSSTRSSANSIPENLAKSKASRDGICGLQNLGNTCFMNSGLQCLSNTEDLTRTFLEDAHKCDFNPTNRIGTGCKLVKAFAALMKEMWFGTEPSVSPWNFKSELGDFVPQFYGFQQQDSHELISYTLDLIHEDLNRVKVKPIPQEVDADRLTESELAERFWQNHLSRNQSIVVDLMHGQYRSQVTCPHCQNVSLTFDPFVAVSVSLPPKNTQKAFEPVFVPYDVAAPLVKLRVKVDNRALAGDIRTAAATTLGVSAESLQVAKAFNYSVIEALSDRTDISEFSQHYPLVLLEVPTAPQKIPVLLDVLKKPESRYSQKVTFALTRVLLIDEAATMKEVHLAVHAYLLSIKRVGSQAAEPTAAEIAEMYDRDFCKDSPAQYSLNVVNLQREKLQYGSTTSHYSSGGYSRLRCDFCKRSECFNCPLPTDSPVTFKEFSEQNQSGKALKFEVILPRSHTDAMRPLIETVVHESVSQSVREEQEAKYQTFTLQQCLEHSSLPEKLDAENEVFCAKCKKHVQADKQMGIYKIPKVLIIHLKRFKEKGYRREKDDRLIRFPVEGLNMQPFVLGPVTDSPIYDLYAVSNHFGGMGGGHYTAYAKNFKKQEWYGFNDSSASRVSGSVEETVVTPSAYVLFYRRREAPIAGLDASPV